MDRGSVREASCADFGVGVWGFNHLCVLTGRIGFNGPKADHIDAAIEARHYRYDVDGFRVMPNSRASY
jgi:hypothetical protein